LNGRNAMGENHKGKNVSTQPLVNLYSPPISKRLLKSPKQTTTTTLTRYRRLFCRQSRFHHRNRECRARGDDGDGDGLRRERINDQLDSLLLLLIFLFIQIMRQSRYKNNTEKKENKTPKNHSMASNNRTCTKCERTMVVVVVAPRLHRTGSCASCCFCRPSQLLLGLELLDHGRKTRPHGFAHEIHQVVQ